MTVSVIADRHETVTQTARQICAWLGGRVAYRRTELVPARRKRAPSQLAVLHIVHRHSWRFASRRLAFKLGEIVLSKEGPMWLADGATVTLLRDRTVVLSKEVQ